MHKIHEAFHAKQHLPVAISTSGLSPKTHQMQNIHRKCCIIQYLGIVTPYQLDRMININRLQ
jgi:hypothetical protein